MTTERRAKRISIWDNKVADPTERQVFQALSNPEWDWRTINSLTIESGLEKDQVESALQKHPKLTRKWPFPSSKGETIFTLTSEPLTIRERFARFRRYLEFPYKG